MSWEDYALDARCASGAESSAMGKFFEFLQAAGKLGIGGFLLALILFCFSVYEHIKGANLTATALVIAGAFAFCFGAYQAWEKEREKFLIERAKHENPSFEISLGQCLWEWVPTHQFTRLCLSVTLLNTGSASCVIGWVGRYQSPNIDIVLPPVNIGRQGITWQIGNQSLQIAQQNQITTRTVAIIAKGEQRQGRVLFEIPGDRRAELGAGVCSFTLSASDFTKRLTSAVYKPDGVTNQPILAYPDETVEEIEVQPNLLPPQ